MMVRPMHFWSWGVVPPFLASQSIQPVCMELEGALCFSFFFQFSSQI
jgi:hypothetical protein